MHRNGHKVAVEPLTGANTITWKNIIDEISDLPHDGLIKMIFSAAVTETKKAIIRPIMLKKNRAWQCEKFISGAAFHENIPESGLNAYLQRLLEENKYRQIHIITPDRVIAYRISKKNEIHKSVSKNKTMTKPSTGHDREKNYILEEGMPVQALVDLGVFTEDYHVVKAKYSKWRQINNFLINIENGLHSNTENKLNITEFGCGKSYLTFIIYYYFTAIKKMEVNITGYDKNGDIVEFCNSVAQKYKYENLVFIEGDISKIELQSGADMMITLHACDTATDYALYYAIKNRVKYIYSVPCCQHEVNALIHCDGEYALFLRQGLYRERFSALLTDCIRCEVLANSGYAVDVVEFVGEENTPKNAMIRACYSGHKTYNDNELQKIMSHFGIEHTLVKLMQNSATGIQAHER